MMGGPVTDCFQKRRGSTDPHPPTCSTGQGRGPSFSILEALFVPFSLSFFKDPHPPPALAPPSANNRAALQPQEENLGMFHTCWLDPRVTVSERGGDRSKAYNCPWMKF